MEAGYGPDVELSVAVAESFRSEENGGAEGGGGEGGGGDGEGEGGGGEGGCAGGCKGDGGGDGGCSRGLPHQVGLLRANRQSTVWLA